MSFGFAGAAAGAGDALQELLAQRRAKFLQQEQLKLQQAASQRADQGQQIQADQFGQSMAFNREREAADQAERQRVAARQAAADAEAQSERQTAQNQQQDQQGVRRMIALTMRNQDPASQQQAGEMAYVEGVDAPEDPTAPHRQRIELAELQHRNELAQIGAQFWLSPATCAGITRIGLAVDTAPLKLSLPVASHDLD